MSVCIDRMPKSIHVLLVDVGNTRRIGWFVPLRLGDPTIDQSLHHDQI